MSSFNYSLGFFEKFSRSKPTIEDDAPLRSCFTFVLLSSSGEEEEASGDCFPSLF